MHTRRTEAQFDEPSLVPLADMLTNTVGILVFILIFTVLTAGGAVVAKRLPMEHSTKQSDVTFICWGNRLSYLPHTLIEEFLKPLGKPEHSLSGFRKFTGKFNARKLENEQIALIGEAGTETMPALNGTTTSRCDAGLHAERRQGESGDELHRHNYAFRRVLAGTDEKRASSCFWCARTASTSSAPLAIRLPHFGSARVGRPNLATSLYRFNLTGQGRMPKPQ